MRTREILVLGAFLTLLAGCDQRTNPLNPDAVVTVRDVREINTVIRMQEQFLQDPFGNVIIICQVDIDPGRVVVVFQEEYGGQWATVYQYEVEYLDENFNPLGLTPLWGTTSVRIPPRGQASVNVSLVTEQLLNELIAQNLTVVKAHLTLRVRGDYQGQTTGGAGLDYTFDFYHDIFMQYRFGPDC